MFKTLVAQVGASASQGVLGWPGMAQVGGCPRLLGSPGLQDGLHGWAGLTWVVDGAFWGLPDGSRVAAQAGPRASQGVLVCPGGGRGGPGVKALKPRGGPHLKNHKI